VLYRDTPSKMLHDGVLWLLAAIVWYSAVLYGGWPYNYKLGVLVCAFNLTGVKALGRMIAPEVLYQAHRLIC
jgi:hypothetical protein